MKKSKYILPMILACVVLAVSIGYGLWIIVSEQIRGYIQSNVELAFKIEEDYSYYAGETWYDTVTLTYKDPDDPDNEKTIDLYGKYVIEKKAGSGAASEIKAPTEVTFVPSSKLAKWVWGDENGEIKVTKSIILKAVAKYNSNYYTTIDGALAAVQNANSGTVYALLTSDYEKDKAAEAKTISKDTTIPSGVTLSIPYEEDTPTKLPNDKGYFAKKSSKINAYNTSSNCANTVFLSSKLTVRGSLCVYGACVAGTGGSFAGNVDGKFAKLTFVGDSASIVAESGSNIYAYGYIESHETNCEKFKIESGANLHLPFTLYEWRGGTITSKIADTIAPFLRFTMSNIVGAYRVNYGATVTAQTAVAITVLSYTTIQASSMKLISSSSDSFIQLTNSAYIDIIYSSQTVDGIYGKNTWSVYGGAKMNSIDISVSSYKLSTKEKFLPLSYLLDISLFDGIYDLTSQDMKLFPGTVVTIGDGATATANNLILYPEKPELGATTFPEYPNFKDIGKIDILDGGKLIVNGAIGGKISAADSGGIIQVNGDTEVTSQEFSRLDSSDNPVYHDPPYEATLSLPKYANATESYDSAGTYYSAQTAGANTSDKSDDKYAWYKNTFNITIDPRTPGASEKTESVTLSAPGGYTIKDPGTTYDKYHTLDGWYFDGGTQKVTFPLTVYDDTSIYANWTENQYKINYKIIVDGEEAADESGGTLTAEPFTVPDSTAASQLMTEPTITDRTEHGLTFIGWSLSADQATAGFNFTTSYLVNGAVKNKSGVYEETIYALWQNKSYNVKFDHLNDPYGCVFSQSEAKDVAANYYPNNSKIIPSDILENDTDIRKQYFFAGWYAQNANGDYVPFTNLADHDLDGDGIVTLYADWAEKEYTVYFDGNGETMADSPYYINSGSLVLPDLSRNYYKLLGWYDAASGGNKVGDAGASYEPTGDMTLYAQWEGYTVTYDANGGECDVLSETYKGTPLTLPIPTLDDHTFLGWFTDAEGGAEIEDGYIPEADITLYARWQKNLIVTYNANGGECDTDSAEYTGTALTLPAPNDRDGYTFLGWFTAKSGGTKVGNAGESYEPTEDVTLYAHWQQHFTVTYNANDGECDTDSAEYTGTALTLPTPNRTGYSFQGWYDAAGNLIGGDGASYSPTADITLYASWEKNDYTITLDTENATIGDVTNGQTAQYGDIITFTVTFDQDQNHTVTVTDDDGNTITHTQTNDGKYTFTMPAGNVTISASSESCLAAGTLVTLADGTQKKIEDVLVTDKLLVFDHETGKFVVGEIMLIETHGGWGYYDIINVRFSNGAVVRIINEHGFFDLTLNKYVYITEENYEQFIGHEFAVVNGDKFESVTLEEVFITTEYTGIYNIVTKYHLNCISEGLLSMSGAIEGTFNIFEYDEDLKYDEDKMAEDIEKYGLFTYEDFAEYVPKEVFDMFPAQYFKVSIGKGYTTYEELIALANEYLVKHGYYTPSN